jgi:hypothetical protein
MKSVISIIHKFNFPAAAKSPATTSSESPGRKKPIAQPVSAKIMKNNPK